MYITNLYIENRANEMLSDPNQTALLGMILACPPEEVSFYITQERAQVTKELINYLKGN